MTRTKKIVYMRIKQLIALPLLALALSGCGGGENETFYKVGFLGAPCDTSPEWNDANMQRMKELGFNTIQLNVAWGYRPGDNPLNMEDVVAVPDEFILPVDTTMLNENTGTRHVFLHSPEKIAARADELRSRIALCKKYGMRTIFHFGAPYVAYPAAEPLSQCISDGRTVERYKALIRKFHEEFPGVDDLLMYTYDQNAWLCSENGVCDKCFGRPLHERVSAFVNTLAATWRELNPGGRLWWEPWEISGGQTFAAMELLDTACVGLSLHSSITEVQLVLPADRWFKNMLTLASKHGIPVIGELWLGSATEETEPYTSIPTPLATLRALKAVNGAGKLAGIKEYYGNLPDREDVNLRMTAIFFDNPEIGEEEAMKLLAAPYGPAADEVREYWTLVSRAFELYPWDISWFAREVGKSNPCHALTAATLKGASWQTPSWQSNRRAAFMRTSETDYPHFWMLEDAQLRFKAAADCAAAALEAAGRVADKVPAEYSGNFRKGMEELAGMRQRMMAYVYHIRETNLCSMLRSKLAETGETDGALLQELNRILKEDNENQGGSDAMAEAIDMLEEAPEAFLEKYFRQYADSEEVPEHLLPADWGNVWSLTSK